MFTTLTPGWTRAVMTLDWGSTTLGYKLGCTNTLLQDIMEFTLEWCRWLLRQTLRILDNLFYWGILNSIGDKSPKYWMSWDSYSLVILIIRFAKIVTHSVIVYVRDYLQSPSQALLIEWPILPKSFCRSMIL